jgi:uncharacterized membrane protein
MDPFLILDTVFRIVHVGTAITVVGGSVFMAFVLMPSATAISDAEHDKLRAGVLGRWKMFVHIGVALFIISGFYNFARMAPLHKDDGLYHALVGTKILLAFGVFFIAEALVGKSKAFEGMRQNRGKWLKIIVTLAAIIVSISGFVKVRGIPDAAAPAAESVSANSF